MYRKKYQSNQSASGKGTGGGRVVEHQMRTNAALAVGEPIRQPPVTEKGAGRALLWKTEGQEWRREFVRTSAAHYLF